MKLDKTFIKDLLRKYKDEAYLCLYPPSGWEWGSNSRKYKKHTLDLLNKILKDIPKNYWPEDKEDNTIIKNGNWRLDLMWTDDKRAANLIYSKDDHTAWVIENKKGKFVDFDIGGS